MTNSSPQTPPPSPEEERLRQQIRNRVRQETTDEWIAILVAFGAIGAILFWSLGFRKNNFFSTQISSNVVRSEDRVASKQVFTPSGTLETESQYRIVEKEPISSTATSFFDDDLYRVGRETVTPEIGSSLIVAAPMIGAVTPQITTPEPEVAEPEVAEPEPEAVVPEPEPETEAVAPEPEPEPEAVVPEPEPEAVVSFDDVPEEHWAYPFINELGKQQLIAATSDNNFEPDDLITRAGMATLVSQAFAERPKTKAIKDFKDIDDGNIIAEDIDKAVTTGFMKGYSDDEFRPAENIPRYQVLVALATGLDLKPSGDPVTILQDFSDRDKIPKWAISQVAAATEAGLTVNRPDFNLQSLKPEEPATRAEVAAMIYQTLQQLEKVNKVDSEYIVPKP